MDNAESEARRALARLRRAAEKVERELGGVAGALRHAEAEDFPADRYDEIAAAVRLVLDFTEEEGDRLREKILHAGGLEPGRVRRS